MTESIGAEKYWEKRRKDKSIKNVKETQKENIEKQTKRKKSVKSYESLGVLQIITEYLKWQPTKELLYKNGKTSMSKNGNPKTNYGINTKDYFVPSSLS